VVAKRTTQVRPKSVHALSSMSQERLSELYASLVTPQHLTSPVEAVNCCQPIVLLKVDGALYVPAVIVTPYVSRNRPVGTQAPPKQSYSKAPHNVRSHAREK